ncbi:MAG TPA: hydrogenase maturation protease [Gaiellaceae bacterium]
MTVTVVGVGNAFRGDDAVGLEVVRLLDGVRTIECEGEPISLLDAWDGCERVILVDAMQSGAQPGTIRRIAVSDEPLPPELQRPSTHLLGVAEAVELARALGRLPPEVVVYAIEGERFDAGAALTPAVAAAAVKTAAAIQEEVS